jgi:hypothetical protein
MARLRPGAQIGCEVSLRISQSVVREEDAALARVFVSHSGTETAVSGALFEWLAAEGHELFSPGWTSYR